MPSSAARQELKSPDGLTVVSISDEGNRATYSVSYNGKDFILPSPLGLNTNIGNFVNNLVMTGSSDVESVSDSYSLPNIKKSHVDYKANKQVFTFGRDGKKIFDVIFEVSDNNVAFRYRLHPQGETLCAVVDSEATGFKMPEDATTFLCPQSGPMGGFARTSPSYETSYTVDDAIGKNGWGQG
ncbi:MAG: glycoside hydrolase family 97 N-terminal domain-containing protein, partial [Duncaniella sp.]|nr:glycoside hydrolase family 97 N-terminal domain-containing protein [Duncaniella sp.]